MSGFGYSDWSYDPFEKMVIFPPDPLLLVHCGCQSSLGPDANHNGAFHHGVRYLGTTLTRVIWAVGWYLLMVTHVKRLFNVQSNPYYGQKWRQPWQLLTCDWTKLGRWGQWTLSVVIANLPPGSENPEKLSKLSSPGSQLWLLLDRSWITSSRGKWVREEFLGGGICPIQPWQLSTSDQTKPGRWGQWTLLVVIANFPPEKLSKLSSPWSLRWKCRRHVATCRRRHDVSLQFWPDGSVSPTQNWRCRGSLCRFEPTFPKFSEVRM